MTFGPPGWHTQLIDVAGGQPVLPEKVADAGAEMLRDDVGQVGGEHDAETLRRLPPGQYIGAVGIHLAAGGDDLRAAGRGSCLLASRGQRRRPVAEGTAYDQVLGGRVGGRDGQRAEFDGQQRRQCAAARRAG